MRVRKSGNLSMIEILAMTAVHARTYVQTLAEEQGSPKAARRVGGGGGGERRLPLAKIARCFRANSVFLGDHHRFEREDSLKA